MWIAQLIGEGSEGRERNKGKEGLSVREAVWILVTPIGDRMEPRDPRFNDRCR